MKEATGELNMTVITVVAIAAVALLFYTFVWPMIQGRIVQTTCDSMGADYTAKKATGGKCAKGCYEAQSDDAGAAQWCCCP
ncbi:MAG: hypothetical protein ACI33S_05900 [Bacilli bacterium]